MTDKLKIYKITPASNNTAPPFGWPEGMSPSAVNDTARQMMASLREWYEDAEWRDLGHAVTSVAGQVITLTGDVLARYGVGLAIRVNGTLVGTITASALATGNTAVTVEGFTPPASITQIEVGITLDTVRRMVRGTSQIRFAASNGAVELVTAGATRVSVGAAGRVLLGPTLPTDDGVNALQVNGTVSIGAGPLTEELNVNGTDATVYTATSASASAPNGVNMTLRNASATNGGFAGIQFAPLNSTATSLSFVGALSNAGNNSATTVFGRRTGSTAYTEDMRISAAGNLLAGTQTDDGAKLQIAGNLSFQGASRRITGDMSNGTISARSIVQSSAVNGYTDFTIIPNGTSALGALSAFNNSAPDNASYGQIQANASTIDVLSGRSGVGAFLPMRFLTSGAVRLTLDTAGLATFGGDVFVNGGDLSTASATFNLLNATATTVNFSGAATALTIGATTGTATIRNPTIVGSQTTQNLFNTVATTVNFAGAATALTVGATTGTTTVRNNLSVTGTVTNADGGSLAVGSETVRGTWTEATPAEAVAGTSATDVITARRLTSAFNNTGQQSLTANGYQKLPGGLILQWGTVSIAANTIANYTFPISFPTSAFSVTGSGAAEVGNLSAQDNNPAISAISTTGFTLQNPGQAAANWWYMAVGI